MYRIIALMLCSVFLQPVVAAAQDRVALIIGQSKYKYATPLKNPINDAKLISKRLELAGFVVVSSFDEPRNLLGRKIGNFIELGKRQPLLALVFFAGHGVQVDGSNYLIPIDAEIASQHEIRWNAISVDFLLSVLQNTGPKNILVFLDACRDDPFEGRVRLSDRGLAPPWVGTRGTGSNDFSVIRPGIAFSYSTAAGKVASDGPGKNSPYALSFVEVLEEPDVTHSMFLRQLRERTRSKTNGKQIPESLDSIQTDPVIVRLRTK